MVVAEFPTVATALLGVRLAGLKKSVALLPGLGSEVVAGEAKEALPLLCQSSYAPLLEFSRPNHRTESERAQGHSVSLQWHSPCALLSGADCEVGDGDWSSTSGPRYLICSSFMRAGYSKTKLLARHATLLPSAPMVAELLLLLFARDATWLLPATGGEGEICGAEVATGDDCTQLTFEWELTPEVHTRASDWSAAAAG